MFIAQIFGPILHTMYVCMDVYVCFIHTYICMYLHITCTHSTWYTDQYKMWGFFGGRVEFRVSLCNLGCPDSPCSPTWL